MERMAAAALAIAPHFTLTCTYFALPCTYFALPTLSLHCHALTRDLVLCLALILHWLLHLDVDPVQTEIKVGNDTHCSVVDLLGGSDGMRCS